MNLPRPLIAAALIASAVTLSAEEAMIPLQFSIETMDRSVDPRVDFYNYANGGWMKATEMPGDKSRWGAFDALGENNWRRIRGILDEAAAKRGAPGTNAQKIGDFYASAMDQAAIDQAGMKPLEPELRAIDKIRTLDDLALYLADAHRHGTGGFFGIFPYADQRKNDTMQLIVGQGGLSLPTRDYYLESNYAKFLPEFSAHIAKVFEMVGLPADKARADAETVLRLETEMAKISKTQAELRDPIANYNKMTVDEAAALVPKFPLKVYFKAVGLPASETHVNMAQPKFFEGLDKLFASESIDAWKAYLRFQAIRSASPYLSSEFENENFRFFSTVLSGTPAMEPRWQRSARVLDAYIGFAVGELYVSRYFPPEVRARLESMVGNMREVLRERITKLEWMSPETKEKALEKLSTFRVVVGYPPKWRDYSSLKVSRESYYGNVRAAAAFENARQMAKFGKPFDKAEWLRTPQQVNAYYQPSAGQLVFLAGILHPPYFDPEMDDAVNYGAIVSVIGHEITHGFDDTGRRYDAQGNLADWWTPQDETKFKARAQKLIDQYGSYEVLPGLKVNGQLTLGENIADLGGSSIAFEALQRSLKGKERKLIDGLTPEQRFFIAWAQVWRTKFRDDALRRQVAAGPHSPGMIRAIGPLVNQQEFYDAFGIKEGDPMWRKPEDRAKIW